MDDPRQILAEAGVECAEVDEYEITKGEDAIMLEGWNATNDAGEDAILALARLVAKYKWQRDIQIGNEYHDGDEYMAVTDEEDVAYVVADLDRRWSDLHP